MKDLKQELEALSVSLNELKETMNLSLNLLNSRIENAIKTANEKSKETRLIPFDVEKAKQGAKLVTTDGLDARILCYDRKSEDYPIVAAIMGTEDVDLDQKDLDTIVRKDCANHKSSKKRPKDTNKKVDVTNNELVKVSINNMDDNCVLHAAISILGEFVCNNTIPVEAYIKQNKGVYVTEEQLEKLLDKLLAYNIKHPNKPLSVTIGG